MLIVCLILFIHQIINSVAFQTIPDQAAALRDQIRREAYITNEIVIKQETKRAALNRSNSAVSRHRRINQNNWNMLLSNKLSGSQLDLFILDHSKPTNRDTDNFIKSEVAHSNNAAIQKEDEDLVLESKV